MLDTFSSYFGSSGFMPHGHCFLWTPSLLWIFVGSNFIIAASYFSIPFALWYFVQKRRDLPFPWIFIMFGLFVMACGTAHVIEIWNVWHADYWADAGVKALTAIVSAATAALLWPLIPRAMAIPSRRQIEDVNRESQNEVLRRERAETELRVANEALERRVAERTAELEIANRSLRDSEARFRSLSEMSSDFFWETDSEHRFTHGNWEANPNVALALRTAIGKRRWEAPYVSPDEASWQAHRAVLDAHLPFRDFQLSRLGADGTERFLSVSGDPLFDASGAFTGYRGVGTDITERKRSESQLRLAASVFDHALEAITITDADANVLVVNRSFTAITGYAPEEVIGQNPRLLKSGRQGSDFYRAMWKSLLSEGRWSGEIWNRRKDGGAYPEQISISAVRDGSGKTVNYVAVFSDLTQRVAAEQAIRTSESRYRTMFDEAPEGVWLTGSDLRTIEVNRRLTELLGYLPEEIRGRPPTDFADEKNRRIFEAQIRLIPVKPQREYEIELRHKNGHNIPTHFNVSNLYAEDGSFMGALAFVIDLTERMRHEEELRRMNEELEQRVEERTHALQVANRELESFCYSVSHDLRSPLRAINGFSRVIEEDHAGNLDEHGTALLRRISAAADRMGNLIEDLLELSRISRQDMHLSPVDLSSLAREVAEDLHAGEPLRQVEWLIAPGIRATGDAGLLRVALHNLLGNAFKYSSKRDTTRIEFGVAKKDGRPVYIVRDNGAGFDMAYADKLFGAFQRLHSPTEFPGTGIGLATVARIVHRHGGKIWAEGKVGEGSSFYFTF